MIRRLALAGALALALAPGLEAGEPVAAGPIALDPTTGLLHVVHPDLDIVATIDPEAGRTLARAAVADEPRSVAVDGRGRILVACRRGGVVDVLDADGLAAIGRVAVGEGPTAVVVDPVAPRAYVALGGGEAIAIVSLETLAVVGRIGVEDAPGGLAVSGDGSMLVATHFYSGRLTIVDLATGRVRTVVSTGSGSNAAGFVALDRSSGRAYLPHIVSNVGNEHRLFDTTVFPLVSVVDVAAGRNLRKERLGLDAIDRPVSMPAALALGPGGRLLHVVCAASDDLSIIDLEAGLAVGHVDVGSNPRGIVASADGRRVHVLNVVGDEVAVVDVADPARARVVDRIEFAVDDRPADVRRGQRLFFSSALPELSRDRWMSCASCHLDGGIDRRTWPTPRGPRNTQPLFHVDRTAPLHWSADRADVQAFQETIQVEMGGTGLRAEDLDALAAYCATLTPPPPSPGGLGPAAVRGRRLFEAEALGCASCHAGDLFTDRRLHDVGTGGGPGERLGPAFDTPTLLGLSATAPYLHDGRAATLADVVGRHNAGDRHGRTSHLSPEEVDDLVAYLRALPAPGD